MALTTGQAARICLVTSDTILNWIKRDRLQARRTAGGQFRILVEDLRSFMVDHQMETDLLDAAFEPRRYCWETEGTCRAEPIGGIDCDSCLVFRTQTLSCFELRCAMSSRSEQLSACERCPYMESWRWESSGCRSRAGRRTPRGLRDHNGRHEDV